jgi:hypothetical protein
MAWCISPPFQLIFVGMSIVSAMISKRLCVVIVDQFTHFPSITSAYTIKRLLSTRGKVLVHALVHQITYIYRRANSGMAHAVIRNSQRASQPWIASMSSQYHNLAIWDPVMYFLYYISVQSRSLWGLNMSHPGRAYSSLSKSPCLMERLPPYGSLSLALLILSPLMEQRRKILTPKISRPFWWILGLKYVHIDMWANDKSETMFFYFLS